VRNRLLVAVRIAGRPCEVPGDATSMLLAIMLSIHPENKNGRFKTIVRITLKITLTTIQNKHPGPTRRNETLLQSE
jgi:hypothetical protein